MKSEKIKFQSILFSSFDYGEANKIYTFFTQEVGIVKAIGYNTKKANNRFRGILELCNELELILSPPKKGDLYVLSECSLIKSHHKIRENSDILAHLYYIVELITTMLHMTIENNEVFDLITITLENFNKNQGNVYALSRAFQLKVLKLLGYLPDLMVCTQCHNSLNGKAYITKRIGWFLCSSCRNNSTELLLPARCYNYMVEAISLPLRDVQTWDFTMIEKNELDRVINMIIYSVINKRLITEKLI